MSTPSVDQVIEAGWRTGVPLAALAAQLAPHLQPRPPTGHAHAAVMDRVRALGLPDRDPWTRAIEAATTVPAELTSG